MWPKSQDFPCWKVRKAADLECDDGRKHRPGERGKRRLRFGAAVLLGAAALIQTATVKATAASLQEEEGQDPEDQTVAFNLLSPNDKVRFLLALPFVWTPGLKQLTEQIEEIEVREGMRDPTYGTVHALGTTADNSVHVFGLGMGSEITATGWSDTDAGPFHAIRWTLSGGTQDLGTLLGAAGNSIAFGISGDDATIVGWSNTTPGSPFPSGLHAFRWTQAGGMQDLGSLQGASGTSIAWATNSDGSVIVGQTDTASSQHAFRWTQAGGMQDLGSLGSGFGSVAYAVSADGTVVVGNATVAGGTHAFRWTQATGMQDLGSLAGMKQTTATSVSADGSIVVGYADPTIVENGATGWTASTSSRPFRWTQATGLQDLNTVLANAGVDMTGTTLRTALAITADGMFFGGSAVFPDTPSGNVSAYMARYCDAANAAACTPFANPPNSHDFNGDGKSDIFWRDTSGDLGVWLMNGGTVSQSSGLGAVPGTLSIIGQHDFDGDGNADVLWRDAAGNISMWFMNGAAVSSAAAVSNLTSNWTLSGTGDLNGDGKGDLLWRDSTTGTVAVWFMNGAAVSSTANFGAISGNWTILGDGYSSILWRDSAGDIALWGVQNGQIVHSSGLGTVTGNFVAQGIGDFNGDGNPDVLWRDTNTGALSIWFTNGTQVTSGAAVGTLPTNWNVAQIGDFDGDGKSDILLLDSAGDVAAWLMNGASVSSSVGIGNVGPTWQVQNLNAN